MPFKVSFEQIERAPRESVPSAKAQELRDGFPVLSNKDYRRMYETDIREFGEDTSATFDFQGFVRLTKRAQSVEPAEVIFKDAIATNGILKTADHPGIHVGTDGVVNVWALEDNVKMRGPWEVCEYNMYVTVPKALQREKGVVCGSNSCRKLQDDENIDWDVESDKGWIVVNIGDAINPQIDAGARTKVAALHEAVVQYIKEGRDLSELEDFIIAALEVVPKTNAADAEAQKQSRLKQEEDYFARMNRVNEEIQSQAEKEIGFFVERKAGTFPKMFEDNKELFAALLNALAERQDGRPYGRFMGSQQLEDFLKNPPQGYLGIQDSDFFCLVRNVLRCVKDSCGEILLTVQQLETLVLQEIPIWIDQRTLDLNWFQTTSEGSIELERIETAVRSRADLGLAQRASMIGGE